jgi:hypothetical protein
MNPGQLKTLNKLMTTQVLIVRIRRHSERRRKKRERGAFVWICLCKIPLSA